MNVEKTCDQAPAVTACARWIKNRKSRSSAGAMEDPGGRIKGRGL